MFLRSLVDTSLKYPLIMGWIPDWSPFCYNFDFCIVPHFFQSKPQLKLDTANEQGHVGL
jgi:hypothetical protein